MNKNCGIEFSYNHIENTIAIIHAREGFLLPIRLLPLAEKDKKYTP